MLHPLLDLPDVVEAETVGDGGKLASRLRSIHLQTLRENARLHATAIAAA